MRSSSMILVVLLSSASLAAQTSTGNSPTILVQPPSSHACPVVLSVDRVLNGAVVLTNGAPAPHRQGLTLTFFQRPAQQIVAADVTVYFYPASVRAIPAAPGAKDRAESPQTFHLGSASGPLQHSSIWTDYTAPVSWVELTRLEYADGTTWQSSAPRQCGAEPSLFVLVDAAR
jgi:hypothetical protein